MQCQRGHSPPPPTPPTPHSATVPLSRRILRGSLSSPPGCSYLRYRLRVQYSFASLVICVSVCSTACKCVNRASRFTLFFAFAPSHAFSHFQSHFHFPHSSPPLLSPTYTLFLSRASCLWSLSSRHPTSPLSTLRSPSNRSTRSHPLAPLNQFARFAQPIHSIHSQGGPRRGAREGRCARG